MKYPATRKTQMFPLHRVCASQPIMVFPAIIAFCYMVGCQQSKTEEKSYGGMPMNITDIAPDRARALLEGDARYTYLDVRTVEEFEAGRPPNAVNIPLAQINPISGRMEPNPSFLNVVETKFPRDAQLIVGCKSGGRSARAVDLLRAAGYTHVINMVGGFSGVPGHGQEMVEPGWSTLGYPVETGDAGERNYKSISGSKP